MERKRKIYRNQERLYLGGSPRVLLHFNTTMEIEGTGSIVTGLYVVPNLVTSCGFVTIGHWWKPWLITRISLTLSQEEEIGMSHNYHVGMEFQAPHVFSTATGMKELIIVWWGWKYSFPFDSLFLGTNLTRRVPCYTGKGWNSRFPTQPLLGYVERNNAVMFWNFLVFLVFPLSWSFYSWCCYCCFLFVPIHVYGFLAFPLPTQDIYVKKKIQETHHHVFPRYCGL